MSLYIFFLLEMFESLQSDSSLFLVYPWCVVRFPYKATHGGIFIEVVNSEIVCVLWVEVCLALLEFHVCAEARDLLVCLAYI